MIKIKWPNKLKTLMVSMLILSMMNIGLGGFTFTDVSAAENKAAVNITSMNGLSDRTDIEHLFTQNLIQDNTPLTLTVKAVQVKDNLSDNHLEITLCNTGNKVLTDFDIYFSMTNPIDSTTETYYEILNDLSINPGKSKTIFFDNKVSQKDHYAFNSNGLYGDSPQPQNINGWIHAKGYESFSFTINP